MLITRYGQSAMLVEEGGSRILIDPGSLSGDAVFELDGLDAILITHEHADHVDAARMPALLEANPGAPVYAPASVIEALGLGDRGHGRAVVNGDRFAVGGLSIEAVGELHQIILPSMPRCANVGFVFAGADGRRVFHPGDSYETVPADIDTLALPLLGPWNSLREAVDFVAAVAPKRIFPIHDVHLSGTGYALFWNLISQTAGTTGIEALKVAQGEAFSPTAG